MGAPKGSSGDLITKTLGKAALFVISSGTSEIKTGGKYGDETLADSLFPSQVNGLFTDRNNTRAQMDKDAAARTAELAPPPPPDLGDTLLKRAGRNLTTGQGRRGSFLTGYK